MHDFKIDNLNKIKFFIHCVIPSIVWSHTESEFPTFPRDRNVDWDRDRDGNTNWEIRRTSRYPGEIPIPVPIPVPITQEGWKFHLRLFGVDLSGPERG